jgi:hypothetical protein
LLLLFSCSRGIDCIILIHPYYSNLSSSFTYYNITSWIFLKTRIQLFLIALIVARTEITSINIDLLLRRKRERIIIIIIIIILQIIIVIIEYSSCCWCRQNKFKKLISIISPQKQHSLYHTIQREVILDLLHLFSDWWPQIMHGSFDMATYCLGTKSKSGMFRKSVF